MRVGGWGTTSVIGHSVLKVILFTDMLRGPDGNFHLENKSSEENVKKLILKKLPEIAYCHLFVQGLLPGYISSFT